MDELKRQALSDPGVVTPCNNVITLFYKLMRGLAEYNVDSKDSQKIDRDYREFERAVLSKKSKSPRTARRKTITKPSVTTIDLHELASVVRDAILRPHKNGSAKSSMTISSFKPDNDVVDNDPINIEIYFDLLTEVDKLSANIEIKRSIDHYNRQELVLQHGLLKSEVSQKRTALRIIEEQICHNQAVKQQQNYVHTESIARERSALEDNEAEESRQRL